MIPGEYFLQDGDVELNADRPRNTVRVENTGDRPIQVGSHTHFFETNRALRFEPGEARDITLVPLAGRRVARGMSGAVDGPLDR